MRFPRNARMFHGQFDAAPFVAVAFLMILFFLVQSALVFTPGVKIQLPAAEGFSGSSHARIAVAMDLAGRLYFDNQVIEESALIEKLERAVKESPTPLALVIQADEGVSYQAVVRLGELARAAGFAEALLATRPRIFSPSPN